MSTITVPYRILADGYEITGDVRNGLHATVPYLLSWNNAFTFINEVLVSPAAVKAGFITWVPPLQFPVNIGQSSGLGGITPPVYTQRFTMKPCGAGGTPIPNGGLAPGEFFTNAIVTLQFDSVTAIQQSTDDPYNLNQLDPENPLTACEQSVQTLGKVVTRKGAGYTYTSGGWSGKPVPGDIPIVLNETKLVLKFPRVPYLPWQLVQPYVGKINSVGVLQCVQGSLLLEGMGTDVTPGTNGTIQQKVALEFAFNPDPTGGSAQGLDWNAFPFPDGSGYGIINAAGGGGQTPYSYADFRAIFAGLNF